MGLCDVLAGIKWHFSEAATIQRYLFAYCKILTISQLERQGQLPQQGQDCLGQYTASLQHVKGAPG